MFKNQPKGLYVAFFTSMGERFGFYTMMAILVLFLQVKYGLSVVAAGDYYSWFYFAIYALAILGGMIADWSKQYKSVVLLGQIIMLGGYIMMALPELTLNGAFAALMVISLGNGLFKGNLQAIVGQLYDNEKYAKYRDFAFLIFYMGINIGAFFAPFAATAVRNWWLTENGFLHDASLPSLAHRYLDGTLQNIDQFRYLANNAIVSHTPVTNLSHFAQDYLDVYSRGYNYVFAIAAGAMLVSLLVYIVFYKLLPKKSESTDKQSNTSSHNTKKPNYAKSIIVSVALMVLTIVIIHQIPGLLPSSKFGLGFALGLFVAFAAYIFQLSTIEERPAIISLILVFIVVIFFWMSFHQNGLTMTLFARDYVTKNVNQFTYLFFNLPSLLSVIATIVGVILLFRGKSTIRYRVIGSAFIIIFGSIIYYFVTQKYGSSNAISPEIFLSFNPLFIVALTPGIMGLFSFLSRRGIEPSTPRKIGIGMIIAAIGFGILLLASLHLPSPYILNGTSVVDELRVTPYWLMSSYLVLTVAELFLSPMGISFVSKVAPKRFQGLMQGGWLLTTAVGNKLLFVGSLLWNRVDLYILWGVFIIICLLSAIFIFAMMRRLERVTKKSI